MVHNSVVSNEVTGVVLGRVDTSVELSNDIVDVAVALVTAVSITENYLVYG